MISEKTIKKWESMPQDTCGDLFLEAMIPVVKPQSIHPYGTLTTTMSQLLVTLWPSQDGKLQL